MEKINIEEKIDFIYETLKKQEKRNKIKIIYKVFIRLFFIAYIIYFILFWYKILLERVADLIKDNLTPSMTSSWLLNNENIKNIMEKLNF